MRAARAASPHPHPSPHPLFPSGRPGIATGGPLLARETGELTTREVAMANDHTEEGRRNFLKGAAVAAGGAAGVALIGGAQAQTPPAGGQARRNHYYVPATDKTVHWGYFSK